MGYGKNASGRDALKNNRGFTLVELMAVLAILAVIAVIAVPRFAETIQTAKEKADRASAQIIARAAEQMYIDINGDGQELFSGTLLRDEGYLREQPVPQASEYGEFIAIVDEDGICKGVYYGADEKDYDGNNNLLERQ